MNTTMTTALQDAHVSTWVKHHARELSKSMLGRGYRPEGLHAYEDQHGAPLYWRIRLKHPQSGDKWIRPMRRSGNAAAPFELKEPQAPANGKPLYRLPSLQARPDAPVFVVEGERCADKLAALGLLATTSGAADSAAAADWHPLARREVCLWPDNDEAGARYALEAARILQDLGCRVRVLNVPELNLPPKGDCVDWLAAHREAKAADVLALPQRPIVPEPVPPGPAAPAPGPRVELLNGADVTPEAVTWLWQDWLAAGKLHILGGAPGTGKTTLALALAATLTTGGRWPDGTGCAPGSVAIWSGEDGTADTLAPRLRLMGADVHRVHFVHGISDSSGRRPFDPATDVDLLRASLRQAGDVRLLLVDPVVSAVTGEGNSNPQVRRSLQPLVDLGKDLGCAVLGITHFRKGSAGTDPVERINGSVAYAALARVVLVAAKRKDEGGGVAADTRLLLRAKSNNGPDTGGFEYQLQQDELRGFPGVRASRVLWGKPIEGEARDILADAEESAAGDERSATTEAMDWLQDTLAHGSMIAGDIIKAAGRAGITEKTLRRARERLGIKPHKDGFRGGWCWALPAPKMPSTPEDAQESLSGNEGILGSLGHLRGDDGRHEVEI
jgi:DNA polymerase III delta prime subunit